jgi:TrpR family trp operon transcriptional repressor
MKARRFLSVPAKHYKELYALIAALDNEQDAEALLKDLLTPQELDSVTERWQEVQLLAKGMPQRDIAEKLGISISKITRGSRALQYGTGGFLKMLKKLGKSVTSIQ